MAYLRLGKDLGSDQDWKHEMKTVSKGLADQDYCKKLESEAQKTAKYVQERGVNSFTTTKRMRVFLPTARFVEAR